MSKEDLTRLSREESYRFTEEEIKALPSKYFRSSSYLGPLLTQKLPKSATVG
jgi:hypothetical protein